TQRIASKVGDIESFGADPRRVEYAGANLKEVDFGSKYEQQTKALLARYDSFGVMNKPRELNDYVGGQSFCCGEKELVSNNQTGDNTFETPDYEHLIFFYHPDHLGSTALVTDNDGNVVQSVAYIPYGEVFIEERNGTWNTPYLFNGKELDEETGLYYYGARYLNPTNGMWLSVDPLFEKYVGMSPYNYCAGNPVKLVDPDGRRSLPIDEEYNGFNARVDSWYGPRNIKNGSKNHKGLDFNYSCGGNNDYGSPIIATHDGTVNVKDNTKGGEGRMVTITSHDDKFRTRYMHLSSVDVENGTNINEGDILGYMGGSGKGKEDAYLSHLHYEIQKFENDKWISINPTEGENKLENIVDPQSWLVKPSIKSAPEPTNENLSPINHSINDRSVRSSKTNWTDYFRNMYNSINNKIYEAIFSQFQY
ncbi:MAG: hypothetical protein E7072_10525, partial [Bacteroidales bacterium]|nr:hypothetical protein [Bacteroidales bacterium]